MGNEKPSMLEEFIECYKNNNVLWDKRIKDNGRMKKTAYIQLCKILRKVKKNATFQDVKSKINQLHFTYINTTRRMKRAKGRNCHAIWWYDLLLFLGDVINIDDEDEENPGQSAMEINVKSLKKVKEVSIKEELVVPALSQRSLQSPCPSLPSPGPSLPASDDEGDEEIDNFDNSLLFLTKTWTRKLQNISKPQILLAEKTINDILFEAQMGTLTRNSVKILPSTASSLDCDMAEESPYESHVVYVEVDDLKSDIK